MKFSLATITLGIAVLPELVSAGFSASCTWDWQDPKYVVATCKRKDGSKLRTRQDMNLCIKNDNGYLVPANNGQAFLTCANTSKVGPSHIDSECDWDEGYVSINLDTFMENQDGYLWCFGHRSAPY
ncbi:hypothetical protein QBC43DRAFT_346835 [Cladorrhinum sp. PSN259]|nr:hypothetical protein QBC43DRAFT_346835 [Cladorrhinum sp. PSN259]